MKNCEGTTSSTRSFEYSEGLVKKCFLKKCEILKCHNFLISYPIFIIFAPIYGKNFTLSFEIMVILDWTSPLKWHFEYLHLTYFLFGTPKVRWKMINNPFDFYIAMTYLKSKHDLEELNNFRGDGCTSGNHPLYFAAKDSLEGKKKN